MKKILLQSFLIFFPFFLSAQYYSYSFFDTFDDACPFDENVVITQASEWLIYQTLDGTWNGEIDSSRCIDVEDIGFLSRIHLDQVEPSQPLFIRSTKPMETIESQRLFNLEFFIRPNNANFIKLGNDCANDLCTGVLTGIQIPDASGTGHALRLYQHVAGAEPDGKKVVNSCFATENFEKNFLQEFILKISFAIPKFSDEYVDLYFGSITQVYGHHLIDTDILVPTSYFDGTAYQFPISDLSTFESDFLLNYSDSSYPSAQNISYIESFPNPNTVSQQTINLYIEEWESLIYQPFAQLRGGLVEGDTLRHMLNLINDGGDFCITYVELLFEKNTHFVYHAGQLDFNSPNACMMFRGGGSMIIKENAKLYYGNNGAGILAISPQSKIIFEKNAALYIDNQLMLLDDKNKPDQETYISLNPGNELVFGKNASLIRNQFATLPVRLNVYMNGGILDDSALSGAEKKLINKICPPIEKFEKILVFPNPNDGSFNLKIKAENNGTAFIDIYDAQGKQYYQKATSHIKGINEINIKAKLIPGIYWTKIIFDREVYFEKIMVQ